MSDLAKKLQLKDGMSVLVLADSAEITPNLPAHDTHPSGVYDCVYF